MPLLSCFLVISPLHRGLSAGGSSVSFAAHADSVLAGVQGQAELLALVAMRLRAPDEAFRLLDCLAARHALAVRRFDEAYNVASTSGNKAAARVAAARLDAARQDFLPGVRQPPPGALCVLHYFVE